ncbi:Ig-like domain-containing protein [Urinicoccus massiliensis]|uniref:Ig-like domain-containing protein n=1 Tax=Urinicoccus massiliensis TaxID=1723382 RepID=UPI000931321B|nr:Ig-like domain-containing protein [Urinicoccus massiliensis]
MNNTKHRFLTLLLVFVMFFTTLPLNVFAASGVSTEKNEITDIKTVGDKQVINLGKVQGKSSFRFFSRSARLFGATTQQAGSSSETVAQKVEISLETLGLNLGDNEFDPSALTEAGSFDVEITFKELGGKRTETRTMTFQAGETKKTETFYLPKDMGQGVVEAEIPKLKDTIALRVYVSANNTTNFNLGQDMTYKFELSQIIHPVIDLKVVDPYGKELQENINQALGLKLALEDEHDFILRANTKTFNIRTLSDFAGNEIEQLNSTGANPTLSLTTQLDANKRLKVGDKTYKLNKITYNALGQEVEINGQKQKVGGYIEFATQPKIIVPTPDDNGNLPKTPDGYKRLSFHAESSPNAQDGRFKNGEKLKVIDVLEGTEYTDKDLQNQIKGIGQPTPIINGRVDDNKKFLKWKPELPTTGPVADTDFYPVYLKDGGEITPGEKLPDGVFEVKVTKDDTIAKDPLYGKSYGVFQGSKLARDKFPDLEAAAGHQNPKWTATPEGEQTVDEAKPWNRVIDKNIEFKATASKLPDIIENPTKPTPEGYVRVSFVAGEGVEDFKDAKTYDVKEGTALTKEQYPTAKAKVGYKDPKWDVAPGTPITKDNATITATATKEKDIIPGGDNVEKPAGYYVVEFLEGKRGEFKPIEENGTKKAQVTVYYVNPEAKVKMSQITAPTVTAKVGYKFDSWSKEYQPDTVITGDRQITAVYIHVDAVSTVPKEGWTKVTLKSGDKGQFTKTTNVSGGQTKTEEFDDLVYYVDPEREVTIPAPVVKATVGNTFTGFDQSLTGTFKTETVITAKYLSTSDVIEDKTPGDDTEKPEGYVTVKFEAGQNGTFAPNSVTKFFVNPEKEVEIGAPGIEPNKNFVFKGFFNGTEEHSSAKKMYKQDVTYTAKYEDKSNESIIPGDQPKPGGWVTISFSAGEHGTFELVEGKQPTIAYHVNPEKDIVLKDKAPAIKANDGYKFTNYDPDVETARKYTTEGQVITAQYKATVVTKDPNDAEHYAKVEFLPGDQGKFEQVGGKDQVTTFWVWKGEEVNFNAPKVTANDGFVFNTWDPILQTKYTDNQTHTAKYEPKSDISDKPVAGFQEVKFVSGKDGKFEGDKTEKSVWVRPNVQVDLTTKAPKVIADEGKVHTGWKPSLIGTFTKSDTATEITAQYKTDADKNGIADEDETTATPTVTARNIGTDNKTTVEGKAPKGSTVTIKYTPEGGQETTKTVTAGEDGIYKLEIEPKLPVDTEVKVTAKDGEKKVSPEVKTQVFDDKDNDGKDDRSQNFDITKADKIEMVYDPAKMDYLVTSKDGKVALETKGMVVKVTDKAGVEKKFTAEEIAKDTKNFTVEPADGADLTIAANNGQPIKVTLNVKGASVTEAKTSNLSVKLDANNNGIADEKEKFDIAKTTKVTIIQDPSKMNYLVNEANGTTPFETAGVVIKLEDASGKTVTYNAEELKNLTDKITLSPAEGEQLGLDNGKTKTTPFTVTITGAEATDKPTATGGNVVVKLDADQNGTADEDEKTPEPEVYARNIGKNPDKTTVEVETEKNADVTIEYKDANGETQKIVAKADDQGKLTKEIKPILKDGTEVKVTVKDGEKQPTEKTVKVFDDVDDNKIPDDQAGQTERPAAIASNVGSKPTFTTIKGKTEKGATITVTVKVKGEEKPVTVENLKVNDDGTYTLEAKYDNKPLENGAEIFVYAENAPKKISEPQTTTVFNDVNKDGKPDGGKVDLTDVKDIQVIAPDKMSYTQGEKLVGTGLKAVVRDNGGNIEIFDYDNTTGKFKDADGKEVADITATVNGKAIKDLLLTEKDHNGKAIDVKVGDKTGSTNQKLEVKQLQTPTPTIEFAANQNTVGSDGSTPTGTAKQKTTVKFTVKNKPTKVFVKYTVNGEAKEETFEIGANEDATKTVDLAVKLPVGAEVKVLAKDADKTLSEAATATVVRDADNNGKADDKTEVGKAEIDPIKAQSESITVKPADNATELVIKETDKSGNTPKGSKEITVTKDKDGIWKIGDDIINPDKDGKLTIPTKDKLKLDEYNVVEVESKGDPDTTTPSTARETVVQAADITAPDKPVVDQPVDGDKNIKVKTPTDKDAKTITVEVEVPAKPGEDPTTKTVVITKDNDGKWKTPDGKDVPEENGKLVIPVDPAVKTGDKVTVEVKDESGNGSKSDPQTVVERQKLPEPTINPIKTGGKTVAGTAKDATTVDIYKKVGDNYELIKEGVGVNSDGTYNYPGTTEFKDGDVIRVVAKKPGMTEAAAETTVGVDTTALDKAIQDGNDALVKTNDGTPEDKALEKAIKDAEDLKKKTDPKPPTQEELNNAQKEIEKAIENKRKTDEERQKLKDIIEEAEKETQKEGYKDKPGKDRRELEKVIKEGKENLKNNTKITESTTKIEKALEKIRKETVQVGLIDTKVGNQSITITTYPNFCKVKIYINDVYIDEIKTDGFGTLRFTLDKPIESGTTIELKAHKDGYNDDSYWTRVK